MNAMFIDFGFHTHQIRPEVAWEWFPGLHQETNFHGLIDGSRLTWDLHASINRRTHMSDNKVRSALQSIFGALKSRLGGPFGGNSQRVRKTLTEQIRKDLCHPSDPSLIRSRQRFLILCYLASHTSSTKLAGVLVNFFFEYSYNIVHYEEPYYLIYEWALGIYKLRHLIHQYTYQELLQLLSPKGHKLIHVWRNFGMRDQSFEEIVQYLEYGGLFDWGRGRRPHRGLPMFDNRSRTAPPQRRHHLPMPLALQAPMPMTPPPMLSSHNPMDELDEVRMRQDMLEQQVMELKEEVDEGAGGLPALTW